MAEGWKLEGTYFESCNCDLACPCVFLSAPTEEECTVLVDWREGLSGAFAMGLRNGVYCVGCCWALMALLFVTGVMNLLWIAVIALFVLVEKLLPAGERVARIAGVALAGYGMWMVAGGIAG